MVKRTEWEALSRAERRAHADPTRKCIMRSCIEPAGTPWGPHYCADHDDERINGISKALDDILDDLNQQGNPG